MSRHRFHGDPSRFEVVAAFVADRFPTARYAADVAGGQGMLARVLSKRYNVACDVVDPRGWSLVGVSARKEEYSAGMADYYDLIIGLHPDEALRQVVESATSRPVLVVPCCNFWSDAERLSQADLVATIRAHHEALGGTADMVQLAFRGPKNIGLVLEPPRAGTSPGYGAHPTTSQCDNGRLWTPGASPIIVVDDLNVREPRAPRAPGATVAHAREARACCRDRAALPVRWQRRVGSSGPE